MELSQNAVRWLFCRRQIYTLNLLSGELLICTEHRQQEEEKKAAWQKLVEESLAKREDYEKKYSVFLREQAGILAKGLSQGEPCPVCGSREHPRLANLSGEAVSQQEVEKARKIRDSAEEQREQAGQEYRLREQKARDIWQQFFIHVKEFFGEAFSEEESRDRILKEQEVLEKEAGEWEKSLRYAADWKGFLRDVKNGAQTCHGQEGISYFDKKTEEARERIQKMQGEISTNRGNLEAVESEENRLRRELEGQDTLFQRMRKEAGFESETQYRESLAEEKDREQWEEEIRSYQNQVNLKEGEVKGLLSQLRGKQQQDMEELQRQEKELSQRLKDMEEQHMGYHAANETNRKIQKNLISLEEESKALKRDAAVAESLSKTAGGRLTQSVKMDLETYVQRRYLKQIIAQANKRFIKMTDRQFMLSMKEDSAGKGKNEGLDLMVYAIPTGTLRDIRTLSGGESFLAALSLALGLSDIVMRQSGGIRLDMMFIDEGFGSLDEESRKKAIEVLRELSVGNRLIGIISHVTELKEQLDYKLCVTRNEKGSSVCWEIS